MGEACQICRAVGPSLHFGCQRHISGREGNGVHGFGSCSKIWNSAAAYASLVDLLSAEAGETLDLKLLDQQSYSPERDGRHAVSANTANNGGVCRV